jgi:hypothetical protein
MIDGASNRISSHVGGSLFGGYEFELLNEVHPKHLTRSTRARDCGVGPAGAVAGNRTMP